MHNKSELNLKLQIKKNKVLFFVFNFFFLTFTAMGGSALGGNSSPTNSLKAAQGLFLRSDYDGVIKNCRRELSSSSRAKPEIRYLLALAYMKKNDLSQAEDNLTKLINECKTLPLCNKALLSLGDVYSLREDYSKARDFYLQVKESSSELGAQVYYRLVQTNLKLGDIEKAKEYSTLLQKEYPLSFETQLAANLNLSNVDFTVQVGAFSGQTNAAKLASDLKEKGFEAYIIAPQNTTDKALYRVRVGKFKTKNEAEEMAQSLSEQGFPTKIFP